jgi:hypothetical protein
MSGRTRHSKKEVEEAVRYAEKAGWNITLRAKSHCWGMMRCPYNDSNCRSGVFCQVSIWRTPQNSGSHAQKLQKVVDNCVRRKKESEEPAKVSE